MTPSFDKPNSANNEKPCFLSLVANFVFYQ